ncbi:FAD-dependent monooxygenase [Streptomyces sp. NBC_01443]|nr:FAD-dependent monooxygenase [Streptomyces sp. NBC_01443]MCX4631307.1 FAD-dependent monooxygenase [Streptomyces sp. NBC_01443]
MVCRPSRSWGPSPTCGPSPSTATASARCSACGTTRSDAHRSQTPATTATPNGNVRLRYTSSSVGFKGKRKRLFLFDVAGLLRLSRGIPHDEEASCLRRPSPLPSAAHGRSDRRRGPRGADPGREPAAAGRGPRSRKHLLRRLGELGGGVHGGHRFLGFTPDFPGVSAVIADPDGLLRSVSARYLVGCDGLHSAVRTAAGIRFPGEAPEQLFALADVRLTPGAGGRAEGDTTFFPRRPRPQRGRQDHPRLHRHGARPAVRGQLGNPRLLLLDEPSDGLTPAIVAQVGEMIREVAAEGMSVVLVEQNLGLALSVAQHVAVM